MDLDLEKPVIRQLNHLGIQTDTPELMNFSFLSGEEWHYIETYFTVALITYYRSIYHRTVLQEKAGIGDGGVSVMRKRARAHEIDYKSFESFHPYIREYVEKFHHLRYRTTLQKFKSDFWFYAWRANNYSIPKISTLYNISPTPVRRYLNVARGRV